MLGECVSVRQYGAIFRFRIFEILNFEFEKNNPLSFSWQLGEMIGWIQLSVEIVSLMERHMIG